MGRGELTHLQIGCQQNIGNHAGNGALAVSAGNMDSLNLLLWIIQLLQEAFDALHAQLDAKFAQAV